MNQIKPSVQINMGQLMRHFLHHWRSFFLSGLITALIALLVTYFLITPIYQASVTVYVNNTKNGQSLESITGTNLSAAQQLVNTYVNIIKSNTVLGVVIKEGELPYSQTEIRKMMTATQIDDTEMFSVTISHPDPRMATHIANTIAEVAPDRISGLVKGSSTEIIDYAMEPDRPYSPNYLENIIFGGTLGCIIMGIALTIQYLFDMRIKTEEDVSTYLGITVLGVIPTYHSDKKKFGLYETSTKKGKQ